LESRFTIHTQTNHKSLIGKNTAGRRGKAFNQNIAQLDDQI
jgi:hypothetical protein